MSSFTTPLVVSPLPDGRRWKLVFQFRYHVGKRYGRDVIAVPMGFVTDFASIPQLLIGIIGSIAILAGYFKDITWLLLAGVAITLLAIIFSRWGKYGKAAVVHDYLYLMKTRTRKAADGIFREGMLVLRVNMIQVFLMYWSVRAFGWPAWYLRKEARVQ